MSQSSVAAMSEAIDGLLADNTRKKDCVERLQGEASAAIPFGRMVKRSSTEGEVTLLSALTDAMDGISVFGQGYSRPDELDDDGLQPGTNLDVLRHGRIYVTPAADVAVGDEVHVRMVAGDAAEPVGQFGPDTFENALVYADKTFTAANTDIVTVATHGLSTGDGPFRLTTDMADLPAGLATGTDYWIIKINANTFKFAATLADALAATPVPVDITDAGTGTHTMSDTADTKRVTSMNLSKLAKWRKSADISEGELAVLEINMTMIGNATVG